jgi:hypothetical protein
LKYLLFAAAGAGVAAALLVAGAALLGIGGAGLLAVRILWQTTSVSPEGPHLSCLKVLVSSG